MLGIFEPIVVERYCTEFLRLIQKYQNYRRFSIFLKYFKINKNESVINTDLKNTYGRFKDDHGIVYDLYDYTPAFYTAAVTDDLTVTHAGPQFYSNISVTLYTIPKPNIDDIVVFDKAPLNQKNIIWRVMSIRSSSVLMNSSVNLPWYELTLEYAPIKNIDALKINDYFVYLVTEEKYIKADLYSLFLKEYSKVLDCLKRLEQVYFNPYLELYSYQNYFPINENLLLYDYLKYLGNYVVNIKKPFGIFKFSNNKDKALSIVNQICHSYEFVDNYPKYDTTVSSILDFNGEINLFTCIQLVKLFIRRLDDIRRA